LVKKHSFRQNIIIQPEKIAICFLINALVGRYYPGTVLSFTVLAFVFGMLYLASLKSVSLYFDKRQTLAMQLGSCGTSVGQFVMAPVIALMLTNVGTHKSFLFLSAFFLIALVPAILYKPVKSDNDAVFRTDRVLYQIWEYGIQIWEYGNFSARKLILTL